MQLGFAKRRIVLSDGSILFSVPTQDVEADRWIQGAEGSTDPVANDGEHDELKLRVLENLGKCIVVYIVTKGKQSRTEDKH